MDDKCLIPRCVRTAAVGRMGLCLVCYSKAKAKVDAGERTWEELEKMGLCRRNADPFDDAYSQAVSGD